jgi:hypothetical protein
MRTTFEKNRGPRDLVESIERGLDRMMTSPTARIRSMREELEREETARRLEFEETSREYRETVTRLRRYLRSLPS